MPSDPDQHSNAIVDQFTCQAEPFLRRHSGGSQDLLKLMADCAEPRATDSLLDVACGPGIVACFFAGRVAQVLGLDMVPAMLDRACRLQGERGLRNVEWKLGRSSELPFSDESFDCVITRFSFHHYLDPLRALREMKRVCRSRGVVLVADVAPRPEAQGRFNQWEQLRDPSHTRALTVAEFQALGEQAGLHLHRQASFSLDMDLEDLLAGSFPRPGDEDRIRILFRNDIAGGRDELGVAARYEGSVVKLTYPVGVFAWRK